MSSKFTKIDVKNKTASIKISNPRLNKPYIVTLTPEKEYFAYTKGILKDIPFYVFFFKTKNEVYISGEKITFDKKRTNKKNGVLTIEREIITNLSHAIWVARKYIKENIHKLRDLNNEYILNLFKEKLDSKVNELK